eukprot:scaffold1941_cov377-Prasinococcus_capsulatus_cf.AAC.17
MSRGRSELTMHPSVQRMYPCSQKGRGTASRAYHSTGTDKEPPHSCAHTSSRSGVVHDIASARRLDQMQDESAQI